MGARAAAAHVSDLALITLLVDAIPLLYCLEVLQAPRVRSAGRSRPHALDLIFPASDDLKQMHSFVFDDRKKK